MKHYSRLIRYGWNQFFQDSFERQAIADRQPGRVTFESGRFLRIESETGPLKAETAGRLRYLARTAESLPTVGDWVAFELGLDGLAVIHEVLPRFSHLVRKTAGQKSVPQLIAANVDTILVMTTVTHDFNPRRIERYLTAACQSGAEPAIVLGKIDLCDKQVLNERLTLIEEIAPGVRVFPISTVSEEGLEELRMLLTDGVTMAIVGSSGVGKSSLINCLCGHLYGNGRLKVRPVRTSDERGRHTTTFRELIAIPTGGLVIDTPGMREFQLWEAGTALDATFTDISSLAAGCRFRDCRHTNESDCAVRHAIENGLLRRSRFESFTKLQREAKFQELREDKLAQSLQRKRWKQASRRVKEISAQKRRGF